MSCDGSVLVVRRSEVREILRWPPLIGATREALIELSSPSAIATSSTQVMVPGAALHVKVGALLEPAVMSVKANLRSDHGGASGAILVFNHTQQRLQAIVASADLTAMRTAAIAAVAATTLIRKRAPSVAILGAGPVAAYTDEALAHLGIPTEVRIWSRSPQRAEQLAAAGAGDAEHKVCSTPAEAVAGAELVITCTPARSPIVSLEDLEPHAVVLAMGADSAGKRELGPGVVESAALFADVSQDALKVGECAYLGPAEAGRVIDIGTVLAGGSTQAEQSGLVVFDSVGSSGVDAAVIALLVTQRNATGSGTVLDLDG